MPGGSASGPRHGPAGVARSAAARCWNWRWATKYGLGTVVAVDGVGQRATATIDFGTTGKVRLMLIGGVPMTKL